MTTPTTELTKWTARECHPNKEWGYSGGKVHAYVPDNEGNPSPIFFSLTNKADLYDCETMLGEKYGINVFLPMVGGCSGG